MKVSMYVWGDVFDQNYLCFVSLCALSGAVIHSCVLSLHILSLKSHRAAGKLSGNLNSTFQFITVICVNVTTYISDPFQSFSCRLPNEVSAVAAVSH